MVDISSKKNERNGIEIIVDNNELLWLNKKHIEEGLDHRDLIEIRANYHFSHRKHRYRVDNKSRKQCNRIFIDEKLGIKVIMDCKTTSAHKFRRRLGFKLYDFI